MNKVEANRNPPFESGGIATLTEATGVEQFWKIPPLQRPQLTLLGMWWCVVTVAYVLVGLAIKRWWEPSAAGAMEVRIQNWMGVRRTDTSTRWAETVSALADTRLKQGVALALLPLMLWMYRRWHDWALVTIGLVFEMTIFVVSSKVVRRHRPIVDPLDQAPTFGWPSGHVAAAVVLYTGLAIVVFANTQS